MNPWSSSPAPRDNLPRRKGIRLARRFDSHERRADQLFERGVRQLRETPISLTGLSRLRHALHLGDTRSFPSSTPKGEPIFARRWKPFLAAAVVAGGLAGFALTQQKLPKGGEGPSATPIHPAKGVALQPMIGAEHELAIQYSRSPVQTTVGPVRIEAPHVRCLKPRLKSQTDPFRTDYSFLADLKASPAEPGGEPILFGIDGSALHTSPVGWGLLRMNPSPGIVMFDWKGSTPAWDLPSEAISFQYQYPLQGVKATTLPPSSQPLTLSVHFWSAPRTALQTFTFHPEQEKKQVFVGAGQGSDGRTNLWTVGLLRFGVHLPKERPYPFLHAVAKIAVHEEPALNDYWPKLSVPPPWTLMAVNRMKRAPEAWKTGGKYNDSDLLLIVALEKSKVKMRERGREGVSPEIPPLRLAYVPSFATRNYNAILPPVSMQTVQRNSQ